MTDSTKTNGNEAAAPAQGGTAAAGRTAMPATDVSRAVATYANFARVTGTPEEILIDIALSSSVGGAQSEAIRVSQRIVMNYYTAKRLLAALQMTVQRHESLFGVLETDIQKRANRSQGE